VRRARRSLRATPRCSLGRKEGVAQRGAMRRDRGSRFDEGSIVMPQALGQHFAFGGIPNDAVRIFGRLARARGIFEEQEMDSLILEPTAVASRLLGLRAHVLRCGWVLEPRAPNLSTIGHRSPAASAR
jgi:hypothetical protein